MIKIQYLLSSLRARGLKGTLRESFLTFIWVNHFLVFYKKLQGSPKNIQKPENVLFRAVTLQELEKLRSNLKLPVEFYCDKSHGFKTPFLAFVNNEVAAIHWVVKKGEYSRFLNLNEHDLELNYNTVISQYRGFRLAEMLMSTIIESYSNSAYKRIFGVVNAENIAQYKPMLRIGFEPVEVLTHFGTHRPKATLRYLK